MQLLTHVIWGIIMSDLLQPGADLWRRTKRTKGGKDDHGSCPGCGIEDLLAVGGNIKKTFDLIYETLEVDTRCVTAEINVMKKAKHADGSYIKAGGGEKGRIIMKQCRASASSKAPNKQAKRIEQKCYTKYKLRAKKKGINNARYINDVVRCTLAFRDAAAMQYAILQIVGLQGRMFTHPTDGTKSGKYKIARLKQIYKPRGALVYGDIKLNLLVTNNDLPAGHNCEVQLNTIAFLKGKGTPDGHGAYEAWRNLDDLHWEKYDRELPVSVADFPDGYNDNSPIHGRGLRAIHKSHDAYKAGALDMEKNRDDWNTLLEMVKEYKKVHGW